MRFDLLAARGLLEPPHRLTEVFSWHQHVPFAFLLTELVSPRTFVELGTHKGDSYCAFCQAVATLSLPTRCHAVDTWEGDAHTGPYPPEVLEEFRRYHDPLYGSFSTLIQSTFEEALEHFADGGVDLLHIDGHHSYASVSQDLQSWRSKLSERGVVLLHDTNMREGDFGVWELWEELSPHYPSFEFTHGHGLGVVAIGANPTPPLLDFLEEANQRPTEVRNLFFTLGENVAAHGREVRREAALAIVQQQFDVALSELEAARPELAALRSRAETLGAELAERDALVAELLSSRSWRVTAAVRAVKPGAKRVARTLRPRGRSPSLPQEGGAADSESTS
jgi:Methyltransferase domain